MKFSTWLEERNWLIGGVEQVERIVQSVFPDAKKEVYGDWRTVVFLKEMPNGHRVTISLYSEKPQKVQLGFSIDRPKRHTYGEPSPKDQMSNQQLMPGTLDMIRGIRKLAARLEEAGLIIWFNSVGERREKLYNKWLGRSA